MIISLNIPSEAVTFFPYYVVGLANLRGLSVSEGL